MSDRWKRKKTVFKSLLASTVRLSACASYGSNALKPGISLLPEVIATMCMPAMNWKYQDGQEQLGYPSGPYGTQSYMVFIGADGRLNRIEEVLDYQHFAGIVIEKARRRMSCA